jgi:hypothetical protein
MEDKVIIEIVKKLFAGADERNWEKVEQTMADKVLLDYTSMAGGTPANLSPKQITESWATFLPGFDKTNHQLSDFKITIDQDKAIATYFGKADHFIETEVWTVEGSYETELISVENNWVITKQKFNFISQSGNTELPAKATERLTKKA